MPSAYERTTSRCRPEIRNDAWVEPCAIFTGALDRGGYGQVSSNGKMLRTHRVVYAHHHGEIPEGLTIDHLCRQRACCEVTHLQAVTMRENLMRGETPSAKNAAKTHCPKGHEYSEANTRTFRGSRYCRQCRADYKRKRRANGHRH